MPRRPSARGLGLGAAAALWAATATAQAPGKPAPSAPPAASKPAAVSPPTPAPGATTATAPIQFRSPDGSRFVLLPEPSLSQVHWAIASPTETGDEPPGLEGLAAAVAQASLGGTWNTGSIDAARERVALEAQDRALQAVRTEPTNATAQQQLITSQAAARELGDPQAFRRVLATLPAHGLEVVERDGMAILQLTTLPEAIGAVAALLLERREQQALRELDQVLLRELVAKQNRYDADPAATVHTELLALALPDQPFSRAAERAGRVLPRRDQAMAVWQATQRPERTVHVLFGRFDPTTVRNTLHEVWKTTALPPAATATMPMPQPPRSLRRSMVPGARMPMVACAWVLPATDQAFELEVAARWLGGGPTSWLGRELTKAGRKTAQVSCRAPWPVAIEGRSLLLVEVQDPSGIDGLVDLLLQQCRRSAELPPPAPELQTVLATMQGEWTLVSNDQRWFTQEVARQALLWPRQPPRTSVPRSIEPRAVRQLLAAIVASQPIVVEGRR